MTVSTTSAPTGFDAGNEFADPTGSVQAALNQSAPEVPAAPAAPEAATPSTWDDKPTEESPAAPVVATPPAAPAKVSVKGNKGDKEFELSPESEDLKRTLSMGMVAPKWKQERDDARGALAKAQAELAALRNKAAPTERVQALTQRGHYEQAVRTAIGDEAFTKFVQGLAQEFDDYQSGDPEKRTAIERSRGERAQRYKDEESEARVAAAQSRLEALESKIETDRLQSIGTKALGAHDFRGFVKDPDQANALNQKLWRLAWSELEDLSEGGTQVTDAVVSRVFADNARVLQSGLTRQVAEKVAQVVETKKADAKAQAQVVATERYPKGTPDLTGWDGRSSKDLLKRLVGRG